MSIVILLIIFLIIVIFGVVLYFIYYKKKKEKPLEIQDKTKDVKECSRKFDIKDYVFDSTPKKGKMVKEKFELSPTTIVDKSLLSEESLYKRGILKEEISNTIVPALNDGQNCLEYPKVIYIPVTSPKLACEPYAYGSYEPISKDCYSQLWSNAGCGGDPFAMPGTEDNLVMGFSTLKQDVNDIAYRAKVLEDPYYMEYCL